MTEVPARVDFVFAHGFSAHAQPGGDPLGEAVAAHIGDLYGTEEDLVDLSSDYPKVTVHRLELARTLGQVVQPSSIDHQVAHAVETMTRLGKEAAGDSRLVAAGHSQGALVMALAIPEIAEEFRPVGLALLTPPLTNPARRLGGPGIRRMFDRNVDISDGYWSSLDRLPDPVALIAAAAKLVPTVVVMAGQDRHLMVQTDQTLSLQRAAPDLEFITLPEAGHLLNRPVDQERVAEVILTLADL